MSRWLDRADDLLYDGEAVRERVRVGDGGVVVTSHRVLVFTPEAAGSNYEAVERPNVAGVERRTRGDERFLVQAVKAIAVGFVLIVAGQTISLDSLVGGISLGAGTGRLGMGGLLATMQSMLTLLAQLDEIMTVVGALALLLGAVVLGVYAWTREDLLVIEVAGGEDVELPAPPDPDDGEATDPASTVSADPERTATDSDADASGDVAARLERAIGPPGS